MTSTTFNSKEEYLSFRATWAASVNIAQSHGKKTPEDFGSITPAHHILYNIIRGKSYDRGFTPVTNSNKLSNGEYINSGLYWGMRHLKLVIDIAKESFSDRKTGGQRGEQHQATLKRFLTVFDGTITHEILANIKLPEIVPMHPNFGIGIAVARSIMTGEFQPTNFSQVNQKIVDIQHVQ